MPAPTLLHLTDTHLFASPRRALRGVVTQDTLERVLERVRRDAWPPDGILLTGDLVHDESRAGYERLRDAFAPLGSPVYCIAGNHDDTQIMREVLSGPPFQCGGSAAFGNWTVVMLETRVPGHDGGAIARADLDRLDATLAAAPDRHALLCLHHHPVDIGSAWLDEIGVANRDELFAVIDAHSNVRVLLWGHVHQAFDETTDRLRLLATPSTCMQFKPRTATFRSDTLPPAARRLTLYDDGRLGTEILWADA